MHVISGVACIGFVSSRGKYFESSEDANWKPEPGLFKVKIGSEVRNPCRGVIGLVSDLVYGLWG
jgi:hypothetical protein